jgi:hypothetical protein
VQSKPLVRARMRCSKSSFTATTTGRAIPRETVITVSRRGGIAGQAALRFGGNSTCVFAQNRSTKTAVLVTRFPEGALFQQRKGISHCTVNQRAVTICNRATVEISDADLPAQFRAICDPDPVLNVAVLRGELEVELRSGELFDLDPGEELRVFPEPAIGVAEFSASSLGFFADQLVLLGIQPRPRPTETRRPTPTPTVTLQPPTNLVLPTLAWIEEGEVLIAEPGAWEGTQPIEYSFSWEVSCRGDGSECSSVDATERTYAPVYNDDCYFVRVGVTARNSVGESIALSEPFDLECVIID